MERNWVYFLRSELHSNSSAIRSICSVFFNWFYHIFGCVFYLVQNTLFCDLLLLVVLTSVCTICFRFLLHLLIGVPVKLVTIITPLLDIYTISSYCNLILNSICQLVSHQQSNRKLFRFFPSDIRIAHTNARISPIFHLKIIWIH